MRKAWASGSAEAEGLQKPLGLWPGGRVAPWRPQESDHAGPDSRPCYQGDGESFMLKWGGIVTLSHVRAERRREK